MIDSTTPHLMTRENPGDTRCAECRMTAGTKAHREGRAAQQASDQGDQVPTVHELSPTELGGLHAEYDRGFRAHSRRPLTCTLCSRSKGEHTAPAVAPTEGQGDASAPTRWVAKRNGRPVANPSQVDIVRGDVVPAPTAPATATATGPIDQVDDMSAPTGEWEETNIRISGRADSPNVAAARVGVDAPAASAARPVIDGRSVLAGAIAGPVPDSSAVAILPAGALAAVTTDPRPRDFDAYRDQIGMCECALCRELAYHAHHWCDRRDQVHAARVLLAHLVAGTHFRMTLKERATEARAHREWLVGQAEAAGMTGEALDRVKHPDVHMRLDARAAKRDEFENGLGLGIGNAPIRAEAEAREAEAPAAVPAVQSGDQGDTVPAVSDAVSVAAPASVDQGDTDAMVRAMIAGATWSYGTGHIGKGRNRKAFRGPMMAPKLDGFVPRDVWTALADTVHALGGGAWMADVKAFACQSSDVGTPWSAGHRSTQERAAEYLATTVSAVDAPAPAVEGGDQGDTVPAVSVDAGHPFAIDPSKPVTVTLVYSDQGDASAAETADQGDTPAADSFVTTHGAHAQRVHVSGVGELNGYRFHLVAGVGCRQFGKPVRRALADAYGRGVFYVTTPAGSGAVNIAAEGDVADWSPVLALVAGIIGDKAAADSASCAECDRSHALAEN